MPVRPVGPIPASIAIIGEAPGEDEATMGMPFVGASGQELTRMLSEAGLSRSSIFLTNVFDERPPANKLEAWATNKRDSGGGPWPGIAQGKYLPRTLWESATERVRQELAPVRPNLIICLGNTASILALHSASISKIRGAIAWSDVFGCKVLPTYHPAAVLRSWDLRVTVILDLVKAKNESTFPDMRFPNRVIRVCESQDDLRECAEWALRQPQLAPDIETARGQITCVGFGTPTEAYVIPIFRPEPTVNVNAWPTLADEVSAVRTIKAICESPVPKVGQNGLYDIQWLYRLWGVRMRAYADDTMIAHHILMPEAQKSLGYLGSIYANVPAWKYMRARGQTTGKRDDE